MTQLTVLEALRVITESIKDWVENKFVNKSNIDSELSSASENPVQNKAVSSEIDSIKKSIGNIDVSQQISDAINAIDYPVDSINGQTGNVSLTADDVGIYVQNTEPIDAVDGDIWVDTANDPSFLSHNLPEVTTVDDGKILMVVNGTWQAVDLSLSADDNGILFV